MKVTSIFYNKIKECWIVIFTNGISNKPAYFRKFVNENDAREFAKNPRLFKDGTDTIVGFGF